MLRVTAVVLLPALLVCGCAATPARWQGEAEVVADPPSPQRPEAYDPLAPDCTRLSAGASDARPGETSRAPEPVRAMGSGPPLLWVTSTARTAQAAPADALPDQTGAAFYREVGAHTKTLEAFLQAVRPPKLTPEVTDVSELPRVLTIAIHREGYRPADRFERIQVVVKAVNFRFVDFRPNGTSFETADLGHLTQETDLSGTMSVSPTPAASAGATLSRTQSYDRALHQRFQDSDVTVAPDFLSVYREGAPGRDLTGALPLQLTLASRRPEQTSSMPVITGVRLPAAPRKGVEVETTLLRYMAASEGTAVAEAPVAPLYVCAQVRYIERRVIAGQRFLDEGRQRVEMAQGVTPWRAYKIVSADEMRPALWRLQAGAYTLTMRINGAEVADFADVLAAEKLRNWLQAAKDKDVEAFQATLAGPKLARDLRLRLKVTRVVAESRARPGIDPTLVDPPRPPPAPSSRLE